MGKLPSFHEFIARIPLRRRLALVSFGLLALLLAALGMFISITEEQTLLVSQANVLSHEMHIAQMRLQMAKTSITESDIPTLPVMSQETAFSLVDALHALLGQDIGVAFVS